MCRVYLRQRAKSIAIIVKPIIQKSCWKKIQVILCSKEKLSTHQMLDEKLGSKTVRPNSTEM